MTIEKRYRKRYKSGNTPWDAGQPDFNLIEIVTKNPILSCKVLDVGCGTGDNSIWLAQNRFQVIGTDISDIAIEKAKEKASKANVKCNFMLIDFLKNKIEGAPFGFVFDRGCLHSFSSEDDRRRFAQTASTHLEETGLWLTIVGNADEDRQGPGPPQRTAGDIALAVERHGLNPSRCNRLDLATSKNPPKAWRCLMQKRNVK